MLTFIKSGTHDSHVQKRNILLDGKMQFWVRLVDFSMLPIDFLLLVFM